MEVTEISELEMIIVAPIDEPAPDAWLAPEQELPF